MNQLDLFSQPLESETTKEQLRDAGIRQAVDHADMLHINWSENAFQYLKHYIRDNKVFMAEDVRESARGIIPEPPSKRAWGGVIVRAVKQGMITRIGFSNVKNIKAHCTPATLWSVKN